MAFFLTALIRRSRLKKYGSRVHTGFIPLKDLRSAMVVMDGTEPQCMQYGEKVEAFFKDNNIRTSFVYIDLRKISKGVEVFVRGEGVITRKDLSMAGIPKMKRTGKLFSGDVDLLVNLRDSGDFTGDFISKVSKAKFKIGVCPYPGNPFDLVITARSGAEDEAGTGGGGSLPEAEESRTAEKIDAVCNFLMKII